eukprot:TRINITY_DN6383_c0_g2_i1.p1 TRINITY_DN6383_c0_g2~~TRINITY_DN6383_c0_g2_i1.p1  ORF type:complete len:502 (-),score=125.91 TRINITY_DN6383_c0_g2_i1:1558-3063(-)
MATADQEMKDAPPIEDGKTEQAPAKPEDPNVQLLADLKFIIGLLEKTANSKEVRHIARVLRKTTTFRKKLSAKLLAHVIEQNIPSSLPLRQELLGYLSHSLSAEMDVELPEDKDAKKEEPKSVVPEVEVYLELLVTIFLIDKKDYATATASASSLVKKLQAYNRRTLFPLAAKGYFYFARAYELTNRLDEIRGVLLAAQRTASLRHDNEGQATILNLLLRNYLHYNLYDQASKLASKTPFPEGSVSNGQLARYLYYQGRIAAIQLDYTQAYKYLNQAIRKAPQTTGRGFRESVHKWMCVVQLLLGEIPERSIFRQPGLTNALKPYLQITKAVRVGDLASFLRVVDENKETFRNDKTYSLIQRLRHNVIKTGLRKINLSYSKISMADICSKLHLDSVDDAEFIVAKAIRDEVIDATINHEGGYIQSRETTDIYTTHEPQEAFHKRISFCLNIRNEAVKALRFPPDAHKPNKESEEARKERLKQEQEIAKNLAEEDDDDDDMI